MTNMDYFVKVLRERIHDVSKEVGKDLFEIANYLESLPVLETPKCTESTINFEAECERLSFVIARKEEEIRALKSACMGMAIALQQEGE